MPKPKSVETTGKVDSEGALKMYNRDLFTRDVAALKDCDVTIIVKRKIKARSKPQMGYYFGCVIPAIREGFREIGYLWSAAKVDEFVRDNFFYNEVVNEKTGTIFKEPLSLKEVDGEVDTSRMEEILSEVRMWAATELSVIINLPNEQGDLMFDEQYYQQGN